MPAPSATPITLPFTTTLGPYSEPQWYVFTTTEEIDFFVSTEDSPSSGNDTALALYDSVGDVVAENEDVLGGDYRSRIDVPALPAGTYYIGLTGFPISTGPDWTLSGGESNAGSGVVLAAGITAPDPGGGGGPGPGGGGGGTVAMDTNARLEKITRRTFLPNSPGSPGSPGQPYIPPRRIVEVQQVCTYSPYSEVDSVKIVRGQPVPVIQPAVYACRDVFVERIIPGQMYIPPEPARPPTPAQTINDFQFGWNSRARSKPALVADGAFNFVVTASSVGVIIGLVPQTDPVRTNGYSDIRWGFYVSRGVVRIYENGEEVDNLGSQPNALLTLRRRLGQIIYLVNNVEVRTTPNESVPLVLSAAMFSGGDTVSFAEMVPEAGAIGEGVMRPMVGIGGTVPYAFGEGEMLPMTGSGSSGGRGTGAGTMAPMIGLGGQGQYATGQGVMAPMTGAGEGGEVSPPYAVGMGYFGFMISTATGLTGGVGGGAASFAPMLSLGSEGPYADGRAVMGPMIGYAENLLPAGEALVVSVMAGFETVEAQTVLMVVMNSRAEVVGLVTATPLLDAGLNSTVEVTDPVALQAELQALLQSVMSARSLTGDDAAGMTVWAMNAATTGTTRYENFPFNSMARFKGKHYGASSQGLFLLDGLDDDGESVVASINFGNMNFGTLARKSLPYVYIGVAADARVMLKVVADGETYYYDVRNTTELLEPQRFELGRGLRAAYYDLTLISDEGALFELADIEFTPVALNRRL